MGAVVHRLGTALGVGGGVSAAAGLLAVVAVVAVARRARWVRRRRESLFGTARRRSPRRPSLLADPRSWVPWWSGPAAVGAAVAAIVGGIPGCLAGTAAAYALVFRRRRSRRRAALGAVRAAAQLPAAAELLAACLAAGAAPGPAAEAVGRTLGGPLGAALRRIAAEIRLGGDPARCWARLAVLPEAYDLARWMARAATTGVPPVAAVTRLAGEYRAARVRVAATRARRAAVQATAPLGLCFLPAFLAVGVVPVVIGLAEVMTGRR